MRILGLATLFTLFWACSPKINTNAKEQEGNSLKVMSYNIHHANPPSKAGIIDLDAVAAVINKENPDIVGLQEVDKLTKRCGNVDQAKVLAEKTGLHYQFFKAIDHDGGEYGVAILSRYPIISSSKVALPQVMEGEARVMAVAEIILPNKMKVTFVNTHLDAQRPDSNRVVQMKAILTNLARVKGAILLVGDLNCEASKEPIALLDKTFKRSCVLNCAPTIPQDKPVKTIDYIALSKANWQLKSHHVIPETYASDHRPVMAVYQLK
ncbi:endonuclease/exonuclease/phosphatase family protein [Pedobacter insulae]|uniref:Metal-dependent hydrolase, endonuclease/exonuclease/phosphatase family n=1 Tax=Pedobacter insulae TaxID=414048 RepID=A0A1I2YH62_9SPHI|nr:endonuclease/exonuclease/phosphatase family protein [Pedobacter insulae]SFH24993.1 Metal-dependent hydrolase, endonuclease/exonuclease/phosphatase family [Pedobacter insulae]